MMTENPFLQPALNNNVDGNAEWEAMYKGSKLGDKISFLPRVPMHSDVARIMHEVDCGVFPSRAEGWNLEALEMMACGKPVILTNYSGHTEFSTPANSLRIVIDEKEEAYDGKWFFGAEQGFGNWAKLGDFQMEQMVYYLREIHKDKHESGVAIGNKFGIETAKQFTWTNTVKCLLEGIEKHG
jgi:glycosyltransferase involved in cell wall biosynthesis